MTAQEMIDSFLLQYDLNGSGAVAGFTDDEILDFLNKSQLDIVKKGFIESGAGLFQTIIDFHNFEMVEATGLHFSNAYSSADGEFPTNFLFYIGSRTNLTRSSFPTITGTEDWIKNREVKVKDFGKFNVNESDKVIFYNPVVVINSNNLTIALDSYTTLIQVGGQSNCIMTYLREPLSISLTVIPGVTVDGSELNIKWHQEIIDAAVTQALLITNDVRIRGRQSTKED